MRKQALIERLRWYYPVERLHAFGTFPILFVGLTFKNRPTDILFLLYGVFVCTMILFQGQKYWQLKLAALTNVPIDLAKSLLFFSRWKVTNVVLIVIMPLMFFVQYNLSGNSIKPENLFVWSLAANLFAILEHINYYYIQLMIDNKSDMAYLLRNKKLKQSSLAKDLKENKI